MTDHELFRAPLWQADSLGRPIPDSVHAVSMALPHWDDVVGYEEKSAEAYDAVRLRHAGFTPDRNDEGKSTRQRWRISDPPVTVDFLIEPEEST